MNKILAIVVITLFIITGTSYGQQANPFTSKDNDIYIEGWYGVDGSGNLTGLLSIDIINRGSSAWSRIDYSGIPDFDKCSTKPDNWTCQYDSDSEILSFIIKSGKMNPNDGVSFLIMYNNPLTKKLTDNGYIHYLNSEESNKMGGLTRVRILP